MSMENATSHIRRGRLFWMTTVLVVSLAAVLLTAIRVRYDIDYRLIVPWQHRAIEEFIGAYSSLALLPLLARLVWRYPPSFRYLLRTVVLYVVALVVYWGLHTSLIWILRLVVFERAKVNPFQEILRDALAFGAFVACATAWNAFERVRAQEVETERLRRIASEAQLVSLRARLHPHFLFNTMNTISSVMYDDPERADTMISNLADMLRFLLRQGPVHEITLAEELALVEKFVFIVRARFGNQVQIHTDVASETRNLCVPALILQPFVENAVQHGLGATVPRLDVWIRARCCQEGLELEVTDNGMGKIERDTTRGAGLGLKGTAERLELLYGSQAHLEAAPLPRNTGFSVKVLIPNPSEVKR
jgi:two-component system, LytTR family, sensor kinase